MGVRMQAVISAALLTRSARSAAAYDRVNPSRRRPLFFLLPLLLRLQANPSRRSRSASTSTRQGIHAIIHKKAKDTLYSSSSNTNTTTFTAVSASSSSPSSGGRRRMEEETKSCGETAHFWGDASEEEYYKSQGIRGSKSFYTSPRGFSLFTRSWQPLSSPPRAIICMVHGYGNDISWTFQSTPIFLAQMGFASFALDLQGHGLSQGLKAFVPNVALVVDDCLSFFNSIKQDPQFQGLPCFLYGESMGGAICLLIHFRELEAWNGAILVAPMCKISDNVRPKWPLPQLLTFVGNFFPTLPIVPTADLLDKSVKVPEKKTVGARNPRRYGGKPRLGTVVELLRVTDYLHGRLSDVSLPFIVLHGSADVVTDPDVSRTLYEAAKSKDKTIKIHDGMMHSLLFGETDENIATVRNDILSWLNQRC